MVARIPSIIAIRMGSDPEVPEGETNPLKLECAPIDNLKKPETYIVKFGSKVAGGEMGIASEIIVGCLATYFEIPIPRFCLVEITEAFSNSLYQMDGINDFVLTTINQNVRGYNFGSLVVNNTKSPLYLGNYTEDQIEMASMVFAFDGLIYNADRSVEVPNLFFHDEKFLVYDHEKCFNFVFRNPITIPKELNFRRSSGSSFLHDHVFYTALHGKEIDFSGFTEKLENLEDDIISESINQVPYSIRKANQEKINAIKEHLEFVREKSRDFRLNLIKVLK